MQVQVHVRVHMHIHVHEHMRVQVHVGADSDVGVDVDGALKTYQRSVCGDRRWTINCHFLIVAPSPQFQC